MTKFRKILSFLLLSTICLLSTSEFYCFANQKCAKANINDNRTLQSKKIMKANKSNKYKTDKFIAKKEEQSLIYNFTGVFSKVLLHYMAIKMLLSENLKKNFSFTSIVEEIKCKTMNIYNDWFKRIVDLLNPSERQVENNETEGKQNIKQDKVEMKTDQNDLDVVKVVKG